MVIGIRTFVYICDLNTMEQVGKQDNFSLRDGKMLYDKGFGEVIDWLCSRDNIHKGKDMPGIITASGKAWREQRRFALKHLKDFGFGKSSMEHQIADEVKELLDNLKIKIKEGEHEVPMVHIFNLPVVNSLWKIIANQRLDLNHPKEKQKIADLAEMFTSFGVTGLLMLILFRIPFWLAKKIPHIIKIRNLYCSLFNWFREEYDKHEKTLDQDHPRDFMDAYIMERQRANEENNQESSFFGTDGEANFIHSMFDLFLAGSETTSTTLIFAILLMLHDSRPFKKAQKELDGVVGRSRLPCLDDRPNLPYFEALMAELMRRANVAPFAVFHMTEKEGMIAGHM